MKNQRWELFFSFLFFPLVGAIITLLLPMIHALRQWIR